MRTLRKRRRGSCSTKELVADEIDCAPSSKFENAEAPETKKKNQNGVSQKDVRKLPSQSHRKLSGSSTGAQHSSSSLNRNIEVEPAVGNPGTHPVREAKEEGEFENKLSHLTAVVKELKSLMLRQKPSDADIAQTQRKIEDLEKANKELHQKLECAKAKLAKYREGLPGILHSKARKTEGTTRK